MTGWLLILTLLVLGGVLSNLGDRLGSRVGKARLSLFRLRLVLLLLLLVKRLWRLR